MYLDHGHYAKKTVLIHMKITLDVQNEHGAQNNGMVNIPGFASYMAM